MPRIRRGIGWTVLSVAGAALLLHAGVRAQPVVANATADANGNPSANANASANPVAEPQRPRINHVLIISEDGLRADAVDSLHLHWHEILRKHGVWAAHAKTIRDASTLPAHASMLSGVLPKEHGLTWNNWRPHKGYIQTPTIFTDAQAHGLTTAFFTGKSKLRHIVPPGTVGTYQRPGYLCKKVAEEAAQYLTSEKPALAFVHFSDPDESGHSKGWMSKQQIHAIGDSDRCLGILYEALEKSGLIEDTLIIVSADHGGHNHVHSGAKLIDRAIPWIACGPGVREDYVLEDELSTMDTAATALYALGLPIRPEILGKPRLDIFEAPKADVK
jgi:predicted AlkP superfamily pyrophosphatase or phosphodiesterase